MSAPSRPRSKLSRLLVLLRFALAVLFCYWPAVEVLRISLSPSFRATGRPPQLRRWLEATAGRFESWAVDFRTAQKAAAAHTHDVAATEWPMFGSVFFLLAVQDAETLHPGLFDSSPKIRRAVEAAAAIVADPVTATWVRRQWGEDYLTRENAFYRSLLLHGLTAHARITGDTRHHALLRAQVRSLKNELLAAPSHLVDDYPGQCWPVDVTWAVAGIQRAAALLDEPVDDLPKIFMETVNARLMDDSGTPASMANARTGRPTAPARGVSNSGLLLFAADLDAPIAAEWYAAYARGFWQDNAWFSGFREMVKGGPDGFQDVDSGPVIQGVGAAASAFGIGAALRAGRVDHAAPMTLQGVAVSCPTPFGFIVPGLMGKVAMDGWPMAESALLFAWTRPSPPGVATLWTGRTPPLVRAAVAVYLLAGFLLWPGLPALARIFRRRRASPYGRGQG